MTNEPNKTIYVLNGPNLNLLGTRLPEVYGHDTLADINKMLENESKTLGYKVVCLQSNHEGDLIDWIHDARNMAKGIIINAGGYSHTSISIRDAIEAVNVPAIEVHCSDIQNREDFRKKSFISDVAIKIICGLGSKGYIQALRDLVHFIKTQ